MIYPGPGADSAQQVPVHAVEDCSTASERAPNAVVDAGDEKAAKEAGLMRSEGKEYVVKDGDVMLFRFNV